MQPDIAKPATSFPLYPAPVTATAPAGGTFRATPGIEHPPGAIVLVLLGAFIVLVYSRAIELVPGRGLSLILSLTLLAYALLSNRWIGAVTDVCTVLLAIFTVLMVPSSVLGSWPGGSVSLLVNIWLRAVVAYLIVIWVVQDFGSLRVLAASIAWGTATIVLLGIFLTVDEFGRPVINVESLRNPNDFATLLLVGLPFCFYYVLGSGRTVIGRVLMTLVIIRSLVMILQSGSRAALLGLVTLMVVLIIVLRGKLRVLMAAGAIVGSLMAFLLLPQNLIMRYQTIFDSEMEPQEQDFQVGAALASRAARQFTLRKSIVMTLQHPIFGVGPSNFAVRDADVTRELGYRPLWLQTHNSYTQVSSECGIPAFLVYIGLVLYCFRTSSRTRKIMASTVSLRQDSGLALCLFTSLLAWAVCAGFASIAYSLHLPLLAAMTTSLNRAVEATLAREKANAV